jgi:hypothetical protein
MPWEERTHPASEARRNDLDDKRSKLCNDPQSQLNVLALLPFWDTKM